MLKITDISIVDCGFIQNKEDNQLNTSSYKENTLINKLKIQSIKEVPFDQTFIKKDSIIKNVENNF